MQSGFMLSEPGAMIKFGKSSSTFSGAAVGTAVFAVPSILQAADRYPDGFWRLFFLAALVGCVVIVNTILLMLAALWDRRQTRGAVAGSACKSKRAARPILGVTAQPVEGLSMAEEDTSTAGRRRGQRQVPLSEPFR